MTPPPRPDERWSDPDTVRRFGARDPDLRLQALLDAEPDETQLRVLDLGCAGGRNSDLLARRGCDAFAVDLSPAMVQATRERVAPQWGPEEAARRVSEAAMTDLSAFEDDAFDLIVALGIFHQASSETEWDAALDEAVRVLAPGGRLLVANFAPGTGPLDAPLSRVPGSDLCYEGFERGRLAFRGPEALDADFEARGLAPQVPTQVVERVTEDRRRVTVNALYAKPRSQR